MFQLFKKAFRHLAGDPFSQGLASGPADPEPASDDDDVLVGVRGNVPIFLGGKRSIIPRLRPTVVRSPRSDRPIPAEQPAIGLLADQGFAPPPGPMARPRSEARALPVLDGPPPRQPYGLEPGEEDSSGAPEGRVRADRAMGALPYGLGPRELTG